MRGNQNFRLWIASEVCEQCDKHTAIYNIAPLKSILRTYAGYPSGFLRCRIWGPQVVVYTRVDCFAKKKKKYILQHSYKFGTALKTKILSFELDVFVTPDLVAEVMDFLFSEDMDIKKFPLAPLALYSVFRTMTANQNHIKIDHVDKTMQIFYGF